MPTIEHVLDMSTLRTRWKCKDCGAEGIINSRGLRGAVPDEIAAAHPTCNVAPAGVPPVCTAHGPYDGSQFASCPSCEDAPVIPGFLRKSTRPTPIADKTLQVFGRETPRAVIATLERMERDRAQLIEIVADVVEKDQAAITELARLGCPLCPEAIRQCTERREKLSKFRLTTLD